MFGVSHELNNFLTQRRCGPNCFCPTCRGNIKQNLATTKTFHRLCLDITVSLPNKRRRRCNAVFAETKKQIIEGALFKEIALSDQHNPRRYVQFRWWAKTHPWFQYYVRSQDKVRQQEFADFCDHINDCSLVYNNWEKICANLNDPSIKHIDARCWTVEYFAKANNMLFVTEFNIKVSRGKRKRQAVDDPKYDSQDIEDIFQHMVSTGILDGVSPNEASSIAQQIERKCVRYAWQHNPPSL